MAQVLRYSLNPNQDKQIKGKKGLFEKERTD
jgi:hypothetical protein